MRTIVCDLCDARRIFPHEDPQEVGSGVELTTLLIGESNMVVGNRPDHRFDLCKSCAAKVIDFITVRDVPLG